MLLWDICSILFCIQLVRPLSLLWCGDLSQTKISLYNLVLSSLTNDKRMKSKLLKNGAIAENNNNYY